MSMLGMPIIESVWLTEPKVVTRSWRERWLSWPWRPWVRMRTIQVPSRQILQMGDTLIMHPAMRGALLSQLQSGAPQEGVQP